MPSQPSNLTVLITKLAAAGVELILVGGLAAVVQGAPVTTFDMDIVHKRAPENIRALVDVLGSVGAYYRGRPGGQRPGPDAIALAGPGHSLFMTDLGPIDALGTIEEGLGYDELLPESIALTIAGHTIRVLSLETIVRLKRASTHLKDRQALPVLEAALRRSRS